MGDPGAAGHFTTMQVRNGRAQGLDLHFARLVAASRGLYGVAPGEALLRAEARRALAAARMDDGDCTLRIRIRARPGPCGSGHGRDGGSWNPIAAIAAPTESAPTKAAAARAAPGGAGAAALEFGIDIEPPRQPSTQPLRLRTHAGVRACPGIKHLALEPQFAARRSAQAAGFDDALLVTPDGGIAEGTFWNVALWDGVRVTWPQAPVLPGVTWRLLARALDEAGIPQRHEPVPLGALDRQRAAFALNSTGIRDIAAVDALELPGDPVFGARLRGLLAAMPRDRFQGAGWG